MSITPIYTLIGMGVYFTSTQTKYLHISLLAKINREEKYSSLTNQNVEEINMTRKQSLGRRNLYKRIYII